MKTNPPDARSALLSNFEVYKFLQEQKKADAEDAAADAAEVDIPTTKEKGQPTAPATSGSKRKRYDVGENLVQVRDQTLGYLSKAPLPTLRQEEQSMQALLKELRQWDLTKGEKLQIVNLAPDSAVMLYSIVEEMEDRFPTQADGVLEAVANSLSEVPIQQGPEVAHGVRGTSESQTAMADAEGDYDDGGWEEQEHPEQQYVDEAPYFGGGGGDDLQDGMDEDD
ncbi:hypothetical protein FRC01_004660 [Tulasnella sp. 417]|nr:hypothetical protein FRC01_004660 [Tulasnella sp. 417]